MTAVAWRESAQRGTWLAELNGVLLTATRLGLDRWQPAVRDGQRGPVCRTRLEAQRWAEGQVRQGDRL